MDLEARGPRSTVARAIVRRLAEELLAEMRPSVALRALALGRPPLAPPEGN